MKWLFENTERQFGPGEVDGAVAAIVETAKGMKIRENLELIFSCIDLTTLNSTDAQERGRQFADRVTRFPDEFDGIPNVAAICVYPNLVSTVRKNLNAEQVKVASVSAGFPASMTFYEVKELETKMAIEAGANEVDIVIPVGEFLAGNHQSLLLEVTRLKKLCGNRAHLKVILETGALKSPEKIWNASILAMQAGADFIKTSTGKLEPAATPEAAWVMCQAIKEYYRSSGRKVGFKPAGGIVETEDALIYLAIVKEVLGDEWLNNELFRIGASRLANNLLSAITEKPVAYF